ncbi:MAG TPA: hypothetical protein VHE99_02575 [Gammaproteobacteria bacterium]|nr:hypothetical protein [Gammaproteobacteria bacterium]
MADEKQIVSIQSAKTDNLANIGKDSLGHVASFFTNRDLFNTTLVSKGLRDPISNSEIFKKKKNLVHLDKLFNIIDRRINISLSQEQRQEVSKLWNNILKNPRYITDLARLEATLKTHQNFLLSLRIPLLGCIPVGVILAAVTIGTALCASYAVPDENHSDKDVLYALSLATGTTTLMTTGPSAIAIYDKHQISKTNELFTAMLEEIAALKLRYPHLATDDAKERKPQSVEIHIEGGDEDEDLQHPYQRLPDGGAL